MAYTERTVDWAITKAYAHAQRKATPPAQGTDKYNVLVMIADSVQKMWTAEADTEWDSLYAKVNNGTVTATDTFDLDDSINHISKRFGDVVRLVSPDGTVTAEYKVVTPNQLYQNRNSNAVAQQGRSLVFSKPFKTTDSVLGYTIYVPAITIPDDLISGKSLIAVDDPMWQVYMMAAEFDRNDVVKMGQYNNLLKLADQHMQSMKSNNSGQYDEIPLAFATYGETWN